MIEPKPEITHYVLLKKQSDDPAITALEVYDGAVFDTFGAAEATAHEAWFDGEAVFVGEVKEVSWQPPLCTAQTYAGSRHVDPEPPEYCENVTELGTEYCSDHQEDQ